jgi:hypothetical protein
MRNKSERPVSREIQAVLSLVILGDWSRRPTGVQFYGLTDLLCSAAAP